MKMHGVAVAMLQKSEIANIGWEILILVFWNIKTSSKQRDTVFFKQDRSEQTSWSITGGSRGGSKDRKPVRPTVLVGTAEVWNWRGSTADLSFNLTCIFMVWEMVLEGTKSPPFTKGPGATRRKPRSTFQCSSINVLSARYRWGLALSHTVHVRSKYFNSTEAALTLYLLLFSSKNYFKVCLVVATQPFLRTLPSSSDGSVHWTSVADRKSVV